MVVGFNYYHLEKSSPTAQGWGGFLRLGLWLVAFNIIFNLLSVRAGATTLFTLPSWRWQTMTETGTMTIMQIGGRVSLESLVYGLSNGLSLVAILLTFATFNMAVDHYRLLRSIPQFLYSSAIVVSIAITFIPQMMVAQQEIREAQMIRGHRFRRIRDLLPLFVTLLAEGLERSITLAEAMESRGFGLPPASKADINKPHRFLKPVRFWESSLLLKSLIALALFILSGGAFSWSYFPQSNWGSGMMVAGGLMLGLILWFMGQRVRRSRYRHEIWQRRDSWLTVAALIPLSSYLVTWLFYRTDLIFYPYPRLTWPPFQPFLALTLLFLILPVLVSLHLPHNTHGLQADRADPRQ